MNKYLFVALLLWRIYNYCSESFGDPILSRRTTAGNTSDTFPFLPVWREC